jgi:hypothetical protein
MNAVAATSSAVKQKANVPARSIALPVEHGAWGFLFEPLAAGMLVAPSAGAPFILLLVVGAFLTRQPLKFLLGDFLQKKRLPRTVVALRFALIFGGVSLLGLVGSLIFAPVESFIPFVIVAPLVIYLIAQDAARQTRQLLPELLAAAALASSVTALALAGGFAYPAAFALWAIMLARLIPSVLYVRSRLRLEKGKPFSRFAPIAAHVLAFAALGALYLSGLASLLTVAAAAFLAGRAAFGLSRYRQILKAKQLGVWEVVYGVIYALTVVFGYYLGL